MELVTLIQDSAAWSQHRQKNLNAHVAALEQAA